MVPTTAPPPTTPSTTPPSLDPAPQPHGRPWPEPARDVVDRSVPAADGHRERKKRETRRQLRLAALTLVAEHGLDGVTTDQIAAAADVSPRTFFNYFADKDDALVGNDPELHHSLVRSLAERPAEETPLEALRAVFLDYADTIQANRDLWALRLRVVRANPTLRPRLVGATADLDRALTTAVAERVGVDPATDPYPALVAAVATASARVALQHCGISTGDLTRPLAEVIDETFSALAAGLPPPAPAPAG